MDIPMPDEIPLPEIQTKGRKSLADYLKRPRIPKVESLQSVPQPPSKFENLQSVSQPNKIENLQSISGPPKNENFKSIPHPSKIENFKSVSQPPIFENLKSIPPHPPRIENLKSFPPHSPKIGNVKSFSSFQEIEHLKSIPPPPKIERFKSVSPPRNIEYHKPVPPSPNIDNLMSIPPPSKIENLMSFPPPSKIENVKSIPPPSKIENLKSVPPPPTIDCLKSMPSPSKYESQNLVETPPVNEFLKPVPPPPSPVAILRKLAESNQQNTGFSLVPKESETSQSKIDLSPVKEKVSSSKIKLPTLGKHNAKKLLKAYTTYNFAKKPAEQSGGSSVIEKLDKKDDGILSVKKKKKDSKKTVISQIMAEETKLKEVILSGTKNNFDKNLFSMGLANLQDLIDNPDGMKKFEIKSKFLKNKIEKNEMEPEMKEIDENKERSRSKSRAPERRKRSRSRSRSRSKSRSSTLSKRKRKNPRNWKEYKEFQYDSSFDSPLKSSKREYSYYSPLDDGIWIALSLPKFLAPSRVRMSNEAKRSKKEYSGNMVKTTVTKPHIEYSINSGKYSTHYMTRSDIEFRNNSLKSARSIWKIMKDAWYKQDSSNYPEIEQYRNYFPKDWINNVDDQKKELYETENEINADKKNTEQPNEENFNEFSSDNNFLIENSGHKVKEISGLESKSSYETLDECSNSYEKSPLKKSPTKKEKRKNEELTNLEEGIVKQKNKKKKKKKSKNKELAELEEIVVKKKNKKKKKKMKKGKNEELANLKKIAKQKKLKKKKKKSKSEVTNILEEIISKQKKCDSNDLDENESNDVLEISEDNDISIEKSGEKEKEISIESGQQKSSYETLDECSNSYERSLDLELSPKKEESNNEELSDLEENDVTQNKCNSSDLEIIESNDILEVSEDNDNIVSKSHKRSSGQDLYDPTEMISDEDFDTYSPSDSPTRLSPRNKSIVEKYSSFEISQSSSPDRLAKKDFGSGPVVSNIPSIPIPSVSKLDFSDQQNTSTPPSQQSMSSDISSIPMPGGPPILETAKKPFGVPKPVPPPSPLCTSSPKPVPSVDPQTIKALFSGVQSQFSKQDVDYRSLDIEKPKDKDERESKSSVFSKDVDYRINEPSKQFSTNQDTDYRSKELDYKQKKEETNVSDTTVDNDYRFKPNKDRKTDESKPVTFKLNLGKPIQSKLPKVSSELFAEDNDEISDTSAKETKKSKLDLHSIIDSDFKTYHNLADEKKEFNVSSKGEDYENVNIYDKDVKGKKINKFSEDKAEEMHKDSEKRTKRSSSIDRKRRYSPKRRDRSRSRSPYSKRKDNSSRRHRRSPYKYKRSRSRSPKRSRSRSPRRSRSRSPRRSRSRSPRRSRSKSPKRSRSRSPRRQKYKDEKFRQRSGGRSVYSSPPKYFPSVRTEERQPSPQGNIINVNISNRNESPYEEEYEVNSPKRPSLIERLRNEHGLAIDDSPEDFSNQMDPNVYDPHSEYWPDQNNSNAKVIQVGNMLQIVPQNLPPAPEPTPVEVANTSVIGEKTLEITPEIPPENSVAVVQSSLESKTTAPPPELKPSSDSGKDFRPLSPSMMSPHEGSISPLPPPSPKPEKEQIPSSQMILPGPIPGLSSEALISAAAAAAAASNVPFSQLLSVLQQQNLIPKGTVEAETAKEETSKPKPKNPKVDLDAIKKACKERKEKKRQEKERKREERRRIKEESAKRYEESKGDNFDQNSDDDDAIFKEALSQVPDLDGADYVDDDDDDEFGPPKPYIHPSLSLPPPQKGILVIPTYIADETLKVKSVKFADGVLPGEGSDYSGGEEVMHSPPPPSQQVPNKKEKKVRDKKKEKTKLIKQYNPNTDDGISSPPPPPQNAPPPDALQLYPGFTQATYTDGGEVILYTQQLQFNPVPQPAPVENPVMIPPGMLVHSAGLM